MADIDIPTEALEAAERHDRLGDDVVPASLISAAEVANPQRSPKIFGPGPHVPAEALEAARAAYDSVVIAHGALGHRRGHHEAINAAVAAAAPHLIAEGRRQAAADIRAAIARDQAENWVDGGGLVGSSRRAALARAAQIAEGLTPLERADKQLRESRERQAGLDCERIERARAAAEARATGGVDHG